MSTRTSGRLVFVAGETKARDFTSRLLLSAATAEKRGGVLFGGKGAIREALALLPPGILLWKSVLGANDALWDCLAVKGHLFSSLDEEGIAPYKPSGQATRLRSPEESMARVWRVLTNNLAEQQRVEKEYPPFVDHVVLTGNPRMDLWGTELREIHREAARGLQERFGKYVFIPSNFGGQASSISGEHRQKVLQKRGVVDDREFMEFDAAWIEHRNEAAVQYVHMLGRLSERYPDCAFVFRPHPAERAQYWRERIGEHKNIHVIREGDITPWILGSTCMIHHGCTSGVEAALLGKDAIAYLPGFDPRFDENDRMRMDAQATDEEGLFRQLDRVFAGEGPLPCEGRDQARQRLLVQGEPWCCDRIAEVLAQAPCPPVDVQPDELVRRFRKLRIASGARRIARKLGAQKLKRLFQPNSGSISSVMDEDRKWPGASLEEVENLLNAFREHSGRFNKVRARQLADDLFLIYEA